MKNYEPLASDVVALATITATMLTSAGFQAQPPGGPAGMIAAADDLLIKAKKFLAEKYREQRHSVYGRV
jgi:hypothetical protein